MGDLLDEALAPCLLRTWLLEVVLEIALASSSTVTPLPMKEKKKKTYQKAIWYVKNSVFNIRSPSNRHHWLSAAVLPSLLSHENAPVVIVDTFTFCFTAFPRNYKSIPRHRRGTEKCFESFMGFLYHFERQIIKNNKWSSASVEVITTCNRTQRVPSGCLSTVNCRCNGAERRPYVSSGSSHFLLLISPARLKETLMHSNSTLLVSLLSCATIGPFSKRQIEVVQFSAAFVHPAGGLLCGLQGLCWPRLTVVSLG